MWLFAYVEKTSRASRSARSIAERSVSPTVNGCARVHVKLGEKRRRAHAERACELHEVGEVRRLPSLLDGENVRWGELSAAGQLLDREPRLAALARQGMSDFSVPIAAGKGINHDVHYIGHSGDLGLVWNRLRAMPRGRVDDVKVVFGAEVRRLRTTAGMTMAELAEEAELTRSYLSEIEHGRGNPTLTLIAVLADALAVEPSELLYGVDGVVHLWKR